VRIESSLALMPAFCLSFNKVVMLPILSLHGLYYQYSEDVPFLCQVKYIKVLISFHMREAEAPNRLKALPPPVLLRGCLPVCHRVSSLPDP
jgi:hypothetical protein